VAHDGTEGLSPDGWLPDRVSVGALTRTFPPELVDAVVEATDTREVRRRLLPARLVVYFVLALWLFRGRNCGYGQVMVKLADGLYYRRRGADLLAGRLDPDGWVDAGDGRRWRPPNISSLSRARGKLGADPLRMLFEHVAGPVGADGAVGVSCCGLRVISVDGSVTDLPDTPQNAAFFHRPSSATRDGAFPQVRWVAAAESGTGALTGAAFGPYTTGEQALALDLLPSFGPGMLVLADRNFLSHTLARDVLATGAHILWRASASFALRPVRTLADGTYLAGLKPARNSDGPPVTVRVIEYTVHTATTGGKDGAESSSEVFALVTDLLGIQEYPALDLACAYPMRWGCETVTGHHKTDMGEGQPVLRSKDPEGVAQEMWALFAVCQAICQLIGAGVDAAGIPPDKISFPHALAAAASTITAAFPP
jgi:Insertion element 4 transposase N-terminal/Transposase DDE domain